ncbi:hypothetical protein [Thiocystis violascens]|uniref:GNAT family N-acetyltransferase n=1 Tax=Thiocystis violascens (strain ATCC 17096 / DSM 198 / 6111) TaxID=765911 RepID=I3Y928_THIV6|nr:hypothetical protein [Thiocystis violascens]AFL73496.1 hypothetical protein Thivi_1495 [Thiocystis violascens DSM 198]
MLIRTAVVEDAPAIAALVGDLLTEIMTVIAEPVFHFDLSETTERLARFIREARYVVFVASDSAGPGPEELISVSLNFLSLLFPNPFYTSLI